MKKNLFITGATGFIGTNLLTKINPEEYENIYCLGRKENDLIKRLSGNHNFKFIKADISEPEKYAQYLNSSDIVLHLAALTGKAEPEEYFRVNSEGTRSLLGQCLKSRVQQFIFISTIAADFTNIEGYHYAKSKIEAEKNVQRSGIPYTILRPAIVIGRGASILVSLLKLAKAPIVPVFGDGSAKIQPIYIDDLVACILSIIGNKAIENQTLTIAGPEQITMEEFIKVLHDSSYKKKFRLIHLPVGPIKKALLLLEKKFLAYLPFTAGQLASFTNDGITDSNLCAGLTGLKLKNVHEMIRLSASQDGQAGETSVDLELECSAFTNYLININPDKYIIEKYIQGHKISSINKETDFFNALLIKAANRNSFLLKLADAYTSIFYKSAVLRKKLLLLLAIMECCPSTYHHIDTVNKGSAISLYMRMGQKAFLFLMSLLASMIVFLPFRFYSSLRNGSRQQIE